MIPTIKSKTTTTPTNKKLPIGPNILLSNLSLFVSCIDVLGFQ